MIQNIIKLLIILLLINSLHAKDFTSSMELIGKLDKSFEWGEGVLKGKIYNKNGALITHSLEVECIKKNKNVLWIFQNEIKSKTFKILSLDNHKKVYHYYFPTATLKEGLEESILEPIQPYFFSLLDFSHKRFEETYQPKSHDVLTIKKDKFIRINLESSYFPSYTMISVFIHEKTSYPVLIDYYDQNKVIFKNLDIHYSNLTIIENKKETQMFYPTKIEMIDLNTDNRSVLEFHSVDRDVKINDSIFFLENLDR